MKTTAIVLALMLPAGASAQGNTCSIIERFGDALANERTGTAPDGEALCGNTRCWTPLPIPCGQRTLITSSVVRSFGNWHYRWASGSGVCVYTASDPGGQHSIGGGRLLTIGNSNRRSTRGGTYYVAEVDAGYWTFAVPGTCVANQIPTCNGRCGDNVTPGYQGIY